MSKAEFIERLQQAILELEDEEVLRIKEISSPQMLTIETTPTERAAINARILEFLQPAPAEN